MAPIIWAHYCSIRFPRFPHLNESITSKTDVSVLPCCCCVQLPACTVAQPHPAIPVQFRVHIRHGRTVSRPRFGQLVRIRSTRSQGGELSTRPRFRDKIILRTHTSLDKATSYIWAHGVVVSRPLSMREGQGSHPCVSISTEPN